MPVLDPAMWSTFRLTLVFMTPLLPDSPNSAGVISFNSKDSNKQVTFSQSRLSKLSAVDSKSSSSIRSDSPEAVLRPLATYAATPKKGCLTGITASTASVDWSPTKAYRASSPSATTADRFNKRSGAGTNNPFCRNNSGKETNPFRKGNSGEDTSGIPLNRRSVHSGFRIPR